MEEIARVFGLDWRLLLIQAINFAVLLGILWYFLYNPILKIIDARQKKIEKGVTDAKKAEERLVEIEGERDAVLQTATDEASQLLDSSKERATEQASGIVSDATHRAESIVTTADLRAKELKEKAIRESNEAVGKAAILAAAKILKEK